MSDLQNINSTLQLIAQQLGNQSSFQSNATPPATASSSPISYPFNNIGTSAAVSIIGTNLSRYGLIIHNPGSVSLYVYPSNMTTPPTLSALGGSFVIYAGSTLAFPSTVFANANTGWSAFSASGSNQPITVVEFI